MNLQTHKLKATRSLLLLIKNTSSLQRLFLCLFGRRIKLTAQGKPKAAGH